MEGTKLFAALGYLSVSYALGIILSPLIYRDAKSLPKLFLGTKPWFWSVCCIFLGSLWVMLVYWAIHHSSFSNRISSEDL